MKGEREVSGVREGGRVGVRMSTCTFCRRRASRAALHCTKYFFMYSMFCRRACRTLERVSIITRCIRTRCSCDL